MVFVLVIAVIVIAGWVYLASRAKTGRPTSSTAGAGVDAYVPVNAYDNPYDTNEANDRPFEPDSCSDTSDDASSGSDSDSCSDSSSD